MITRMNANQSHWDIFCTVVDNYGDIGVTWRLARQLHQEFQRSIRLWVDDLESFQRLCPQAKTTLSVQIIDGIEIHHWQTPFQAEFTPGTAIIEAFACELPEPVQTKMLQAERPPIWLNLEYLSAEIWVDDCHALPSRIQHLNKYFFFPGFTQKTGGLLCESSLFPQRDLSQQDPMARHAFCQQRQIMPPRENEFWISLFSYENTILPDWIINLSQSNQPIRLLIPAGKSLNSLHNIIPEQQRQAGGSFLLQNIQFEILPMTDQTGYDQLLWLCDFNLVRGEDSFLRAQWAGKPFLWHIYPQEDKAHLEKLQAFLTRYTAEMPEILAHSVRALFLALNEESAHEFLTAWQNCQHLWQIWLNSAETWPEQALAGGNLANQLVQFIEKQLECCA